MWFFKKRKKEKKYRSLSIVELEHLLKIAIDDEEYEIAAMIRDELIRRTGLYK